MNVYHGSTEIVEYPIIQSTQRLLDFGNGFYTTTNIQQAENWVLIKKKRLGTSEQSFVTVYEIDDSLLKSTNFNVKIFDKANEEWLDFVVHNRRQNFNHKYDVVMGAVANDKLYQTLTLFETGILSKKETIARLKVNKLFDQISFHNQVVLSELKFVNSFKVFS